MAGFPLLLGGADAGDDAGWEKVFLFRECLNVITVLVGLECLNGMSVFGLGLVGGFFGIWV